MVESITYLWELYQEAEGKLKKALALGLLCYGTTMGINWKN